MVGFGVGRRALGFELALGGWRLGRLPDRCTFGQGARYGGRAGARMASRPPTRPAPRLSLCGTCECDSMSRPALGY